MSLEWETFELNDICILNKSSYSKKDDWKFINYLDTKNITKGKINEIKYLNPNEDTIPSRAKRKVVNKDIIYSTVRPNQEHYGLIENAPENLLVSTGFTTITVDTRKAIPEFVYYFITQNHITESLQTIAEQSTTSYPSIRPSNIGDLIISLPNLHTQKKISSILTNIEHKIKVNENINNNLENLLMEIFKSWFIYFEKYDKSNGMKIDESYGELPKLWSVEMLEDYVDFVTGVEPGSKNYHENPEVNDVPFLRVGDLGSRESTVFIDESLSKNKILTFEDIVLSLDATIGIVKIGLEGAYSTGMRKLVIKNNNINKPFLYCLIKSERIQKIIETFATGTTILHAGKSIKHMNFVLSDKYTMDKFAEIGNPILSTILSNLKEIEILINMRDTLLPKLMSGEIDVSKINCDLD